MPDALSVKSLGPLVRFGLLGAANTMLTTLLFYLLLLATLGPGLAFTISYLLGLAYVVALTPRLVFGTTVTAQRRLVLAAWYVAVYLVGLAAVAGIRAGITTDDVLTVLLTLAVTAPLGFVGSHWIVGTR